MLYPDVTLRTSPRLLALLMPLLLSACGGGGGGGGSSSPATLGPAPQPVAPQPVTPQPATPDTPVTPVNPVTPVTAPEPAAPGVAASYKVGVIDSGLSPDRSEINYDKVHFFSVFNSSTTPNDNQGINGHGTLVAMTLLGLAPASELYAAQASQNNQFNYANSTRAVYGLLDQGVRVINMSYGSLERLTTQQALSDARTRYQPLYQGLQAITTADGLAVISTGNSGTATPAPDVLTPLMYNDSQLARHLIAVTGVLNTTSYDQAGRAAGTGPFDACGGAAAWCLTAPGYTDFVFHNSDGTVANARAFGTSFSAPRVTAAAAQLLQHFPWMSASNLQQTLLTTATYRSDAHGTVADSANGRPYNDTFGWGDLNAARSLNGPGQFQGDDFHAALDGGRYQFSNAIQGNRGLVLDGSEHNGVLQLTGNNSYSGLTQVSANNLLIDGAISGNALVNGSGKLGGSGRIGGTLVNQGAVSGGLQVGGDYQQGAGATLNVTLSHPLQVAGHAALDGTLNLAPPSSTYVVQQQETLLTSGAGRSGQFSSVNTGPFLAGSVSYGTNNVTGQLTRRNTPAAAAAAGISDSSAQQTASNLEQAFSVADRWQTQGTTRAANQSALASAAAFQTLPDAASARSALDSLSGQAHASANAVLFNALDYQTRLLNNRINDAHDQGRTGFWLESGELRGALHQQGYLSNSYRNTLTALGVDTDFDRPDLRAGIAWTHNQLNARYAGSGGNSQNSLDGVMLYGRYDVTPAWYWQGNLSYQHGRDKLQRLVLLDQAAPLSSSTRSDSWQAALQSGYRWEWQENYWLEPYLGWRETGLQTGGFRDQGSAFGLEGSGDSYHRSVGYSGLSLSARQDWSAGWWSMLSLYGEYEYAFSNPALDVSARWSGFGDDQSRFSVPGMQLDRQSQWIGARVDVAQSARARLFLRADRHLTARGDENVLRGGVDVRF